MYKCLLTSPRFLCLFLFFIPLCLLGTETRSQEVDSILVRLSLLRKGCISASLLSQKLSFHSSVQSRLHFFQFSNLECIFKTLSSQLTKCNELKPPSHSTASLSFALSLSPSLKTALIFPPGLKLDSGLHWCEGYTEYFRITQGVLRLVLEDESGRLNVHYIGKDRGMVEIPRGRRHRVRRGDLGSKWEVGGLYGRCRV